MRRYSLQGDALVGRAFVTKCFDCGMGLLSANEFHPVKACEVYKETHSSRKVEEAIEPLFRAFLAERNATYGKAGTAA